MSRLSLAHLKGFPDFENDKILTITFIEASNEVIAIIEQFGTIFYPIVSDMRNNATQLMSFYEKDASRRKYIEDMILFDESKSAHVWLLWLKRALEMIERFFWHLINDNDVINQKSDNLQPIIAKAYTEVLKVSNFYIRVKYVKLKYVKLNPFFSAISWIFLATNLFASLSHDAFWKDAIRKW